jgi:hypothetical protein
MKYKISVLTLAITSMLTGCGGGEQQATVQPKAAVTPPATTTTVTTNGIISGFGSIVVNGVHYSTDSTTISTDDNQQADEQELAVGMMVQLEGSINADGKTGTAKSVKYSAQLEGPVSFIDLANKTLTILGQIVAVDDLTVYERVSLNTINVGDVLEVSGYIKAEGQFYASRIERETKQKSPLKIYGIVSELNTTDQTFRCGNLVVSYSSARFEDFTQAQLANGQLVKVKAGSYDATTNKLVASEIDLEKSSSATTDKVWLEGVISNYQPDTSLMLNGQTFLLSADTKFEYGQRSQLANGVTLKLQAIPVTNGWKAEKISFSQQAKLKLSGNVSALDLNNNSFTIGSTTFVVTPQTLLKDDSNRAVRYFDLKSLVVNDYVEVAAFKNADGVNIALKVERENIAATDSTIELKGVPSAIDVNGFTLFGKNVVTDDNTRFESNDALLSKSQFFALLSTTTVVEVHAIAADNQLLAVKLEIDSDHDDDNKVGKVEFKGAVTAKSDQQIEVNGYKVLLTPTTKLQLGKTKNMTTPAFIAGLQVGEIVKVEGMADLNNIVTATEVEADRDND